jgi:hypothetical protein
MKRVARLVLASLIAGCTAAPPAPVAPVTAARSAPLRFAPAGPVAVKNPGFELDAHPQADCAAGWACTMHGDPKSFRFFIDEAEAGSGKRSFCVEPVKKEPWAMITQGIHDRSLNGARVRLTLAVRLDNVEGAGAGPYVQVQGRGKGTPTFVKLEKGTRGWQDQAVEFEVPEDAVIVALGATLRGRGRACFDDVRLEVLRPGKNPV